MRTKHAKLRHEKPCSHMEGLLNHAAKGTGNRFIKWYALAHAARCGPCRRFLERLKIILDQLKASKAENPSDAKTDEMMQKFLQAKDEKL